MNMVTKEELEDDEEYEGGLYIEPPQPTLSGISLYWSVPAALWGVVYYYILLLFRYHGGCEGRMWSLW